MQLLEGHNFASSGLVLVGHNLQVVGGAPPTVGVIEFATIGDQVGGTIALSYEATGTVDVTVLIVPVGTVTSTTGLAAQIAAQRATAWAPVTPSG
ncbi:MAG: hypothetical protein AAFO86_12410 [Pseudomonadota bacterium]